MSAIRQAFILTKRTASVYAYSPDQLGLCVHASIMNVLVAGLVYRAWPMDLWIGFGACLGGMGMSMSLRDDLYIGAADGKALCIAGVRERHLYRWIVLVCTMRCVFWGVY